MDPNNISKAEINDLQERLAQATIEDKARPAEQILAEQNDQEHRPTLFIP